MLGSSMNGYAIRVKRRGRIRRIWRGAFHSVKELVEAIREYLDHNNGSRSRPSGRQWLSKFSKKSLVVKGPLSTKHQSGWTQVPCFQQALRLFSKQMI
jgi:hypothetical protein